MHKGPTVLIHEGFDVPKIKPGYFDKVFRASRWFHDELLHAAADATAQSNGKTHLFPRH